MTTLGESSRGYPLYALFILVAVCAVVARLLAPVVQAFSGNRDTIDDITFSMGIGMVLTMILGAIVGLCHHRPWRGLFIGLSIGAFVGPLFGALSHMPRKSSGLVLLVASVVSVVLIVVGVVLRMKNNEPMLFEVEGGNDSPSIGQPTDSTNSSTVD